LTLAKYLQNLLRDSTLSIIFVKKKSIVGNLHNAENCLKTLFLWTPVILLRMLPDILLSYSYFVYFDYWKHRTVNHEHNDVIKE